MDDTEPPVHTERDSYALLRLGMPDFRLLIRIILEALGKRERSFSITVQHGRTETPYRTLEAFESALERLPGELKTLTIFANTGYEEPDRLSIWFDTSSQASLAVRGSDEGAVILQKERISTFLHSKQPRTWHIAKWLSTWFWLWPILYAIPANIIPRYLWNGHRPVAVFAIGAFISIFIYLMMLGYGHGFTLVLRPRESSVLRQFLNRERAFVVSLLILLVGLLAWLSPRIPH